MLNLSNKETSSCIIIQLVLAIILLGMQTDKQKFNKDYIDCIMKNQSYIGSTKSCNLALSSQRYNKLLVPSSGQFASLKYQFVSIGKINKVFSPSWASEDKSKDSNQKEYESVKNHELIDIFLRKNEQIAATLMKQKKSVSDLVYNIGKQSKFGRYLDEQNQKNRIETKVTISDKMGSLPKINSKQITNLNNKQQQKYEIIAVQDKRLQKQTKKESKVQSSTIEPSYSDVTNINIKRFLKLKQHVYEFEQANGVEQLALKKKKAQSHKKRLAKKQRQQLRNSLQAYLETKMIPKQQKFSSLRASLKNCEENIEQVNQKQPTKKIQSTPIKTNQEKDCLQQKLELVSKINNRSLPRSHKKIGTNTKFSKKNLLAQDPQATIYEQKIKNYREFIFLVNMVHNVYTPVIIADQLIKNESKYKYFVGKGNNRQLVKALLKRRFWWAQTDDINEAQFVWTQLKVNSYFEKQKIGDICLKQVQQSEADGNQDYKKIKVKMSPPKKNNNLYKPPLPEDSNLKIMTADQHKRYKQYEKQIISGFLNSERYQNFENRRKFLPFLCQNQVDPREYRVHNHFENNFYIGNKKALYYNLKKYCELTGKNLFDIVPLTFHVTEDGVNCEAYKEFLKHFKSFKSRKSCKNIWIVKPGQNSNRGNGISVFDQLYEINKIISSAKNKNQKGPNTFILQKYIEKPLLYKGRKFDIRHYMLATRIGGKMRLYFYGQGYVRTSSSDFTLEEIGDNQVHLTNDAIQKYSQSYGKYQQANKISYSDLQRYLDANYQNRKYSLVNQFYPTMRSIALDTFKACYLIMDPKRLQQNFEIFGLDFMIDSNFHVWLIEVNTNPCLELSSNLLSRIIPTMLQHSFRLTLDPLFPPPCHYINTLKHLVPDSPLDRLQFELIFDEARDGKQIEELYKDEGKITGLQNVQEDQDTFDNDGKEIDIDNIQ